MNSTVVVDNTGIEEEETTIRFSLVSKTVEIPSTLKNAKRIVFRIRLLNLLNPEAPISVKVCNPQFLLRVRDDLPCHKSVVEVSTDLADSSSTSLLVFRLNASDGDGGWGYKIYRMDTALLLDFLPVGRQDLLFSDARPLKLQVRVLTLPSVNDMYRICSSKGPGGHELEIHGGQDVMITKTYHRPETEDVFFSVLDDNGTTYEFRFKVCVTMAAPDAMACVEDRFGVVGTAGVLIPEGMLVAAKDLRVNDVVVCADGRTTTVRSTHILMGGLSCVLPKNYFAPNIPQEDVEFLKGSLIMDYWEERFRRIEDVVVRPASPSSSEFIIIRLTDFRTDYLVVEGVCCESGVIPYNASNLVSLERSLAVMLRRPNRKRKNYLTLASI